MGGKGKRRAAKKTHSQQKGGKKASAEVSEAVASPKPKGRPGLSLPVPGLSNLGNTCFFNSVMQNLGQSHYFRAELGQLLAQPKYTMVIKLQGRECVERQLSVEAGVGQFTEKLSSFLSDMQTGGRVLNPRPVFGEICKKAPRFSGYHQQDSQELLRYLLDALRSEEITRIKRAILTSYKVTGSKKEQAERLTDNDRADIRAYGLQAHLERTFVDNVFGGVLASTVVCKECSNKSTMLETFLDLSLPIGEDKNMTSLPSPMGYQTRSTRSKSKKKEPTSPKARPELSKHQLKKQEKQARKAARSANKKSLQNFLREEHSPHPVDVSQVSGTQEEKEAARTNPDNETSAEKLEDSDKEEPSTAGVEDCGTQEASLENCDTNCSDQQPSSDSRVNENSVVQYETEEARSPSPCIVGDQPPGGGVRVESALSTSGYAADGPQPDTSTGEVDVGESVNQPTLQEGTISETLNQPVDSTQSSDSKSDSANADIAAGVTLLTIDPEVTNSTETKNQPVDSEKSSNSVPVESDSNTASVSDLAAKVTSLAVSEKSDQEIANSEEMVDQSANPEQSSDSIPVEVDSNTVSSTTVPVTESESVVQGFQSLTFEPDSLEASLKKFCTPELLTGANRFACVVCTKLKHEHDSETALPPVTGETVASKVSDLDTTISEASVTNELETVSPETNEIIAKEVDPETPLEGEELSDSQEQPVKDVESIDDRNSSVTVKAESIELVGAEDKTGAAESVGAGDETGAAESIEAGDETGAAESVGAGDETGAAESVGAGDETGAAESIGAGDETGAAESIGAGDKTGAADNMEEETVSVQEDEVDSNGDKAEGDGGEGEDEGSRQGDSSSSGDEESVRGKEDSFEIGGDADSEESGEETSDSPQSKEKESSIVFCEATKQMLIKKPPLILTLHLKRFIQFGRRLQKNNRYVSFPSLLDVGPFLVEANQAGSSAPSPLLYSLYGVVEHSGSMQGGHYIAYIRQRTPPTVPPASSTTATGPETRNVDQSPAAPGSHDGKPKESCRQTNPECSTIGKGGASACAPDSKCTLNFDLSSTKGQWYHVSDSHVRAATESEVMKSQAYLLFYEQLPLI